jgi:hypothetical protein
MRSYLYGNVTALLFERILRDSSNRILWQCEVLIIIAPGLVSGNRDSAGCTSNNNALKASKPLPSVRTSQRTPRALIQKIWSATAVRANGSLW